MNPILKFMLIIAVIIAFAFMRFLDESNHL